MFTKIIETPISLDHATHTYQHADDPTLKLTSCTEFISPFFEPFDKQAVANKLAAMPKNAGKTADSFIQEWQQASEFGSQVHEEIEHWLLNKKQRDDISSRALHGVAWVEQYLPQEHYDFLPECIIFSERLGLAGTIDLLAFDKRNSSYILVDWKTNKNISRSAFRGKTGIKGPALNLPDCHTTKYGLQLSLYQYILETEYNINVRKQGLVHLREEGHDSIGCTYNKDIIEALLKFDGRL